MNQSSGDAATRGRGERPAYPISSVDNALRLLGIFKKQQRVRVSDAAVMLGVSVSTAHRLLAMLQFHDFVMQETGSRSYVAGPALLDIGLAVVRSMDIRTLALPVLAEFANRLGETLHLVRLEGAKARYIVSAEGANALRVADRTGRVVPAHTSATGRALLAELSEKEFKRLLPELIALNEGDAFDEQALRDELDRTRERGYAFNVGGDDGIASMAAVIRDADGRALAAISISGPVARIQHGNRAVLVRHLHAAAAKLEDTLHS
ncbi:IclR family transcriptional regulator [Microbacterium sp. SYP-A9085]|uniref:IclR family transcriptional regulator n=1 Tax=Microbacterium sp. SYP-A9085 TaxID=2664454 RepID=UPI0015620AC9